MCILLSSNNKFINHSNHFGGIVPSLNGLDRFYMKIEGKDQQNFF